MAVSSKSGNEMPVHMRDLLARSGIIILDDIQAFRTRCLHNGSPHLLHGSQQIFAYPAGHIEQCFHMRLRDKQRMAFVDGTDIQKSDEIFGFKDGRARYFPMRDFAKYAIFLL